MPRIDPPSWFSLADYKYTRSLDIKGWHRALAIRCGYASLFDWYIQQGLELDKQQFWEELDKQQFWEEILGATKPDKIDAPDLDGTLSGPEQIAPIEEIPVGLLVHPISLGDTVYWAAVAGTRRVLVVDLDAPDTSLLDTFTRWLSKAREQHPLPVLRRGHKPEQSPNVEITGDHLRKWTDYQVLACFDLNLWFRIFQDTEITHAEAGNWLNPDMRQETDPKDWGRRAHLALVEAASCVDMLAHQAAGVR